MLTGRSATALAMLCLLMAAPGCALHGPAPVIRGQSPEPFSPDAFRPTPAAEAADVFAADAKITGLDVEGNTSIPETAVLGQVKTRIGSPVVDSEASIRDDVRRLYATTWFFNVEARFRPVADGVKLVFVVSERPMINNVTYTGNKKMVTATLENLTGLRPGGAYSVSVNKECVRRIREHYLEKGYRFATVELVKGTTPEERDVEFKIVEGSKVRVTWVSFEGNRAVTDGVLRLHLATKPAILYYFGGSYDPSTIPDDIAQLKQYYFALGYFDVDVKEQILMTDDRSKVTLKYVINEGPQSIVRSISVNGAEVIPESEVRSMLEFSAGQPFNARLINKDVSALRSKYGAMGRFFAEVAANPVFSETPGVVDLQISINEDEVWRIGRINVNIAGESHTRETLALSQLLFAPGDLADPEVIRRSERRLAGAATWEAQGPGAPTINTRRVKNPNYAATPQPPGTFRGQNSDQLIDRYPQLPTEYVVEPATQKVTPVYHAPPSQPADDSSLRRLEQSLEQLDSRPAAATSATQRSHQSSSQRDDVVLDSVGCVMHSVFHRFSHSEAPLVAVDGLEQETGIASGDFVVRAQSFDNQGFPTSQNPVFGNTPQGDFFRNEFSAPDPNFLDVDVNVAEARTGRFMFSVGVNSDQGVIGSVVLEEQNFDITRFPNSLYDLTSGRAFRGNGEHLRIEAVPGTDVSRYSVSWTNPFFGGTDYSLGVSGFYYNRFFTDWEERRLGGRLTLGRLLTRQVSVNGALRLEDVDLSNPSTNGSSDLNEALGNNFLSTGRLSVSYDSRDSSFIPTEGLFGEASVEQAFGQYSFTKLELDARQYYTVYQRADGGGRHIFSLAGNLGWTTSNTPLFEQYYAGGVQSFRGFRFRGVSPIQSGARVGGEFQALGTVEYSIPVTAGEAVRVVTFTDFGTIDDSVTLNKFRMTAGLGMRLQIPAMGPVPVALDWAFPVFDEDEDQRRLFQFYIGLSR